MRNALVLLFVLASHPLLACALVRFDIAPARPTTEDEIEVVIAGGCPDGCIPYSPRVKVGAGTITIDLQSGGGCILIPQPWGERVGVGRVAAGSYDVVVRNEGKEMSRRTVVVREHPFALRPAFGGEGTPVLIDLPRFPVAKEVTFGGVPAVVEAHEGGASIATAPKHGPGLVDVVVTDTEGNTFTAREAFLYPDPDANLTLEHERIFFPSVFAGPGAHGSLWTSDNVVLNRGFVGALTMPPVWSDGILPSPQARALPPGESARLGTASRDGGVFLFVPRGLEQWLAYSSHIVDRSRRATDAGTEMPVVHESETGWQLTLVTVPLTGESRQTLRVFDFDAVPGRTVTVMVFGDVPRGVVSRSLTLEHSIVCIKAPCYPEHPTYAVLNLDAIPELRDAGNVTIGVYAQTHDVPLWAYVSVTNNDTQHVTTYTPQHRRMVLP